MAKNKNKTKRRGPSLKAQVRRGAQNIADIGIYAALGANSALAIEEGTKGSQGIIDAVKTKDMANVRAAVKDSAMNAPKRLDTYSASIGIPLYDGIKRTIRRAFRGRR